MAQPLLEVRGLTTRFRTERGKVTAVDDVSFSISAGQTLAIVGESGSGKSVTALSLMRLIPTPPGRIEAGQVLFEGRDLLKLDDEAMRAIRGNRIAMIFQEPMSSLNPALTVGLQIAEPVNIHQGKPWAQAYEVAKALLGKVHIPDAASRLHTYPHQYSGGMRQRTMIAMALACQPRLIIADEPTTALDVTVQAQILDLLIVNFVRSTGRVEESFRVTVPKTGAPVAATPVTIFSAIGSWLPTLQPGIEDNNNNEITEGNSNNEIATL